MKQIFLIAFMLFASACDKAPAPDESSAAVSYTEAHATAVAAIEYSAERGHAWSTADALLEQAVEASANGDEALAIELALDAREQAEIAAKQADIEERTWSGRVLSD